MPTCCHLQSRLLMIPSRSASAAYSSFHTLTVPEKNACMATAPSPPMTMQIHTSSMTALWQAVLYVPVADWRATRHTAMHRRHRAGQPCLALSHAVMSWRHWLSRPAAALKSRSVSRRLMPPPTVPPLPPLQGTLECDRGLLDNCGRKASSDQPVQPHGR